MNLTAAKASIGGEWTEMVILWLGKHRLKQDDLTPVQTAQVVDHHLQVVGFKQCLPLCYVDVVENAGRQTAQCQRIVRGLRAPG